MTKVDKKEVEDKIKLMYKEVADDPTGEFHFEMGHDLAERLGYPEDLLEKLPEEAVESFAGVGYHFALADIQAGEQVLDLGSGSGMDVFVAALQVGEGGSVVGVDITEEQLKKARNLAKKNDFNNISLVETNIEELPFDDGEFDVVISNGVINLSPEKEEVFKEIGRVLKDGGRLALSDIVTEKQLTESITCNADLWASCIGGAMQIDKYSEVIEKAGMSVETVQENTMYQFLSSSAQGAAEDFGVKSVSVLAVKK